MAGLRLVPLVVSVRHQKAEVSLQANSTGLWTPCLIVMSGHSSCLAAPPRSPWLPVSGERTSGTR